MIAKLLKYEKKDVDVERVYTACKNLNENIRFIKVTRQLDKNEIEEIKLANAKELLELKSGENIKSYTIMTDKDIIIVFNNSFSQYTSISINANKREDTLTIKEILEEELGLEENNNSYQN